MSIAQAEDLLFARDDVGFEQDGEYVAISGAGISLRLGPLSEAVVAAIGRLFSSAATERQLTHEITDTADLAGLPELFLALHRLEGAGVLGRLVEHDGRPLAALLGTADGYRFNETRPEPPVQYRLSRLAFVRRREDLMVLESPLAPAMVIIHAPEVLSVVHALAQPLRSSQVAGVVTTLPRPVVDRVVGLLLSAGMLQHDGEDDAASPLGQWEFHDLLFHTRSRLGRHREAYGGSYPFDGTVDPQPAVKGPMTSDWVELPAPSGACVSRPLSEVLEGRRSVRRHAEEGVSLMLLGELLHRTARHKATLQTSHGELASRPYPGGGAVYELEVYTAIDRCRGLDRGLYQYVPDRHLLCRVSDATPAVERLLDDAYFTMDRQSRPQVLLVLAARFQRVSWKYRSMAYALVLKDVGVLMQTMYLVATDMGLAPCALGGGNADVFAAASGLDYFEEGSVGEFAIGTPADGSVLPTEGSRGLGEEKP